MPESDDAPAVLESLPARPLEIPEAQALEAQEGKKYVTQPLLLLKTSSWAGLAALGFYIIERDEFNILGYSEETGSWEVVTSFAEEDDWMRRQKDAVEAWADDALADFHAEREYVAPSDWP